MKQIFLSVLILTGCFSCAPKRADHSLSIDAYRELGMPDPGRQWNMEDFTQAYNVLAKIKWEKPLQLPVKGSDKSGSLFEHMVSLDHLSFLHDSTMSLNEKAGLISEYTRVYEYWIDIYTIPILKQNRYHREIVDIQIFNLRQMEAMVKLAHQINRSHDPADVGLQFGYNSIKENYLTSLHNDLRTQRKASEFLEEDLDRMADSIYVSVMRNKEWMDSSTVRELRQSLLSVADSTSSEHIRNKYTSLGKSLIGT